MCLCGTLRAHVPNLGASRCSRYDSITCGVYVGLQIEIRPAADTHHAQGVRPTNATGMAEGAVQPARLAL